MITVYTDQAEIPAREWAMARAVLAQFSPGYQIHSLIQCTSGTLYERLLADTMARSLGAAIRLQREYYGRFYVININRRYDR